jgi:hypothetical protein
MEVIRKTLSSEYGMIDYHYSKNESYPNGILIFLGSLINKSERGKGRFKNMVRELFSTMPEGTLVHVGLANKKIIHMFERLGFKRVDWIEYWGKTTNTVKMEGYIYKDITNDI